MPTADQEERDRQQPAPGLNVGQAASNTLRPGLTDWSQRDVYDQWLKSVPFQVQAKPWLQANPGVTSWLQEQFWTYRNDPNMINAILYQYDLKPPGGFDDGGGRTFGGGGGRSAAEQEAIDIENAKESIRNQSETLGIVFDEGAITALATTVVKNGWAQDRLTQYIVGAAWNWDGLKDGTLKQQVDQMKVLASDYLLTISDETARSYATRMASGELTMETVNTILREQAKANYRFAAHAIDQGITTKDYLAPSRDFIASELEMNPNDVNLMDQKWLTMLKTTDEKGNERAATLDEMQRAARSDPGYAKTTRAKELASNMAGMLANVFGL
jgi:hypothetical protein